MASQETGTNPVRTTMTRQPANESSPAAMLQDYADRVSTTVRRYQENPEELKSLLSNRAVLAVGAALGLALLTGQIRKRR